MLWRSGLTFTSSFFGLLIRRVILFFVVEEFIEVKVFKYSFSFLFTMLSCLLIVNIFYLFCAAFSLWIQWLFIYFYLLLYYWSFMLCYWFLLFFGFFSNVEVRRHDTLLLIPLMQKVINSSDLIMFIVIQTLLGIIFLKPKLLNHFQYTTFHRYHILPNNQTLIHTDWFV